MCSWSLYTPSDHCIFVITLRNRLVAQHTGWAVGAHGVRGTRTARERRPAELQAHRGRGPDRPAELQAHRGRGPDRPASYRPTATRTGQQSYRPAATRARVKTSSSIASVTRPVKVFCWLGW